LHDLSEVLPVSHAVDALRAASLGGASLSDILGELGAAAATSVLFLLAGLWSPRHLDDVVRRRGTLDLM
jgi:hypothetical protein